MERSRQQALFLAILLLFASAAVAAQEDAPQPLSETWVAVAGEVEGVNASRWRVDVTLVNTTGNQADVLVTLPFAPNEPFLLLSLAPGQTMALPNVAGDILGSPGVLSPLLVQTFAPRPVSVRAWAYATFDDHRSEMQELGVFQRRAYLATERLSTLSWNDDERSNIGLVNLGEGAAEFTLALQRISGRNVGVTRVGVPGRSMVHLPLQLYFPLLQHGSDFIVIVESSAEECYAYASVIDNETHRADFVYPAVALPIER